MGVKRTIVQLIIKHRDDAAHAKKRSQEWADKAARAAAKADALQAQIDDAVKRVMKDD